ncbi:nucleotide exchange factor GrpE [Microcella alkalica]|uniref:Protein GrpE n=1 Tax=Microcella alkalica TaxID=355930 RepID=A0A839EDF7_9MICO|nr:nucleotide exchange factor GrpE [Microcella alkalica]MBA8848472.1 molecular chaperone GrpE [Microcella alkalica]
MAARKRDDDEQKPVIKRRRRIDDETGKVTDLGPDSSPEPDAAPAAGEADESPLAEDGAPTDAETIEDLFSVEDADVEVSESGASLDADIDRILSEAGQKEIAEYRDRAARAEAELANFRTRVERDRQANREANIAEVIRTLLPAIDDLDRAESHGDLAGSPLELVAQKLRTGLERYGLTKVGVTGEPFDPNRHEALVQLPKPDVTSNVVGDVIEVGYALGDRLIRAAKVAVFTPEG